MQFIDKAFARRLESCEEMPQVLYAQVFQKTRPEVGAAWEEFCGGHMSFCGLGSPVGRTVAMGLDRPFTAADLDHVEEFYRSHNAPAQVDLTPLHEPGVFEMFKERCYAIGELNNVLYRKLDVAEEFPPAPAGCEIRRSTVDKSDVTGAIVESAFFPDGAPEAFRGLIAPLYQMPDALAFVASINGKRVACGTGGGDPSAQSLRALRSGYAHGISRAWIADGVAPGAYGRSRDGRMRVRGRGHARRYDFATQRRTARLSCSVQQGDRDQADGVNCSVRGNPSLSRKNRGTRVGQPRVMKAHSLSRTLLHDGRSLHSGRYAD